MPRRLQRLLLWFVVVYAVVLLFVGRHIPPLYDLYLHGIPTTGIITQRSGDYGLAYLFVAKGQRYVGTAKIGVASIPISGVGDPIYLTYLPTDPNFNVAGDVKDLLEAEYSKCAEWLPWVALGVIALFVWNVLLRAVWFNQTPFAGSRADRISRFLFGD